MINDYYMPFLAKRTVLNNITQITTDGTAPSDYQKALLFDGDEEEIAILNADNSYIYLNFANTVTFDFILIKNCNFKNYKLSNNADYTRNWYQSTDNQEKDILVFFEKTSAQQIRIDVIEFFSGSSIQVGEIIVGEKLFTFGSQNGVIPKIERDDNIIFNKLSNNTYQKIFINKVENINLDVKILSQTQRQELYEAFKYAFRSAVVCVPNPRPKAVVCKDAINRVTYENTSKTYFDGVGGTYQWLDWNFDKEIGNTGLGDFTGFIELFKANEV